MSKTEKNKKIVKMVEKRIIDLGYKGKLEFDPIPNTFKRRNHFIRKKLMAQGFLQLLCGK